MDNKKVYLHIGQQKTASTSIQRFFATNRRVLRRNKYLYPKSLGANKHSSLFKRLDELADPNSSLYIEFFKELERSKCQNLILSEENLFKLKEIYLQQLTEFLKKHFEDITIIVYLRRQYDHAPSLYQELVKGKLIQKYDDWIDKKLRHGYYDYCALLDRWRSYLPDAKVEVRPFVDFVENDIRRDILSVMKVDFDSSLSFNERHNNLNTAVDAMSIELLRLTNAYIKRGRCADHEDLKKKVRSYVKSKAFGKKMELNFEQKLMLWQFNYDSNKKLVKDYNVINAAYFLDYPEKRPGFRSDDHSMEEVLYELSKMYKLI